MGIRKERRKYQRIETHIKVSFQPQGSKTVYPSLIINMSQGGMLLKSTEGFPLDLVLTTKISGGSFFPKDILIPARVNRCETIYEKKLYHIAVEIDRLLCHGDRGIV